VVGAIYGPKSGAGDRRSGARDGRPKHDADVLPDREVRKQVDLLNNDVAHMAPELDRASFQRGPSACPRRRDRGHPSTGGAGERSLWRVIRYRPWGPCPMPRMTRCRAFPNARIRRISRRLCSALLNGAPRCSSSSVAKWSELPFDRLPAPRAQPVVAGRVAFAERVLDQSSGFVRLRRVEDPQLGPGFGHGNLCGGKCCWMLAVSGD
jgi:hypothetical protein